MDSLEEWVKKYALYTSDAVKEAPLTELFSQHTLTTLSHRGMLSYVYRCENTPWVIKEAKWSLDVHIAHNMKFSIPTEIGEKILKNRFLPRQAEVFRLYDQYRRVLDYLGMFTPANYSHPQLAEISREQKRIRDTLEDYLDEIHDECKLRHIAILRAILRSPIKYKNFLPKEYMVMGEGWHPGNKGRITSFIFQEYVGGQTLHDLDLKMICRDPHHRRELILLIYLLILIYKKEKLVVDTRPRSPLLQTFDWIMKTDNIVLSPTGFMLIDTRWCWQTEDDPIRRGLMIPNLSVWRLHNWLNKLLALEMRHLRQEQEKKKSGYVVV